MLSKHLNWMSRAILLLFPALVLTLRPAAQAQQNVRAFYARGQTFVVWQETGAAPATYEIYRSPAAFTNVAQATLAGRLFKNEWKGERLDYISQKLRSQPAFWTIPINNMGGTYTLAANEGLFVFTPRQNGAEYFAVVKTGNVVVNAVNRTAAAVAQSYDPVNDPVQCHAQFQGVSLEGYPYRIFALWSEGRDDENARPDFPVTANFAKNGAPHVFAVYGPPGGPGAGPYPAVFSLHGGGGEFDHFRPGNQTNAGTDITEGVLVTPSDNLTFQFGAQIASTGTRWLGYVSNFDPFTTLPRVDPPPNSLIINYTMRWVIWILDWLQSPHAGLNIDPKRVAMAGHSAGGRGTSMITRWQPGRFASATLWCPAMDEIGTDANPLFGSLNADLPVNITPLNGAQLRLSGIDQYHVRVSPTERDLPFTRIYNGRREKNNWNAARVEEFQACNDSAHGFHLYWDERDHGIGDWSVEDPLTPGADVGQWVVPVRTERASVPYQRRYRSDQSYPAFFNDDQNPLLPGRQPDMGDGGRDVGDLWGTWSGYCDWETDTITDTAKAWACTVYLIGQSAVSVDNAPFASTQIDVAIRKPQQFKPEAGRKVAWRLRRLSDNVTLQSGIVTPGAEDLVTIPGLTLTTDPVRCRLEAAALPKVSGTLRLEGCLNPAQPVHFVFRPVEGGASLARALTLTPVAGTSDGMFLIDNVPAGNYTLHLKGAKWLARNVAVNTNGGDVSGVLATLPAGDADNDNDCDLDDLGLLAFAFNTIPGDPLYDARADLDCDSDADLDDLGLLALNFNANGAP